MTNLEIALDACANLAESPVWDNDAQVLWWVDIFRAEVHRFDPSSGVDEKHTLNSAVGSLAVRETGGLILALEDGLYTYSMGQKPLNLARPELELKQNRFNDGRTDRQGRFWVGSLHREETEATGAFYRLDADGSCERVADGIIASNGTAFSPDGVRGYHADSKTGNVWSFAVDTDDGTITDRKIFAKIDSREGVPDGATVDADGCYWLAHAGGWRIVRYTPTGKVDRIIHLPVEIPTSLTFGGNDLRTLYVTTATYSLSEKSQLIQPLAGSILALDVGCSGVPETKFAG